MHIPMTSLGTGFINARNRGLQKAQVVSVNVSNGMPIISKKTISEKGKTKLNSSQRLKYFNHTLKIS